MKKFVFIVISLVVGAVLYFTLRTPNDVLVESDEAYELIVKSNAALVDDVFLPPVEGVSTTYRVYWPGLDSVNPDIFGWLYIPNSPINFPLLQEQTLQEYFYLDHDYNRDPIFSGSIFTPAEPLGVEDAHLLLFGHHTKNKDVAFSSLYDMYGEKESGESYSDAYICYPEETIHYKLWCVASTTVEDSIYEIPYILGSTSYDKLLRQMEVSSTYTLMQTPSANTPIVVLSTCNGAVGGVERFYVAFVPVD